MSNAQVCFFMLGRKGFYVLERFIESFGSEAVSLVVAARDAGVADDFFDEIRDTCTANTIRFVERNKMLPGMVDTDYSFAISWRWLIHAENTTLVVLHDSLLPYYRGYAPLVSMLENGETELGVTALHAAEEYDMGNILYQARIGITYPLKVKDAIEMLLPCYWECVMNVYWEIKAGKDMSGSPQNKSEGSFSLWRDESDYSIDWTGSVKKIMRFIHATGYPYKGASTLVEGVKIRIWEAEVIGDVVIENRKPGKVIFMQNGFPVVVCGEGLLKITGATSDQDNTTIFPLKKFRITFT